MLGILICSVCYAFGQLTPQDKIQYVDLDGARLFVRSVGSGKPLKESVISMEGAQTIIKLIPNSKLVRLIGVGHFPYIETPNKFSKVVREFLEKRSMKTG